MSAIKNKQTKNQKDPSTLQVRHRWVSKSKQNETYQDLKGLISAVWFLYIKFRKSRVISTDKNQKSSWLSLGMGATGWKWEKETAPDDRNVCLELKYMGAI